MLVEIRHFLLNYTREQGMQSRDTVIQREQAPGIRYCLQASEKMEVSSQDSSDFVRILRIFSANALHRVQKSLFNCTAI